MFKNLDSIAPQSSKSIMTEKTPLLHKLVCFQVAKKATVLKWMYAHNLGNTAFYISTNKYQDINHKILTKNAQGFEE